ncbi:helix-turn-helix domain-containing protein [Actinophytocola algeriensis]|uniref:Transcriptional regulator with XRE-family HTH domain n=1 Tax=Actinophytocola algeriensis TaxID=1768010 RepID=A0A7W7QC24_9PSEU|nr:helix-turn-helix domain-containing protein [Actinophytocola algeriensis]MBB4910792.1 transcriptional regulator with XRE-family HTH domain [Actinophytocola algeriensis]MBE1473785.1 transcriptional regulator with XRE-family HTH domain [Actinophytocola algeriensis]
MAARPAFGAVLRTYRRGAGLTQEELADRAGLSVRAIRNLEIGRTERPQRQTVTLLGRALRLSDTDQAALLAAAGRGEPAPPAHGRCELPPDVPDLCGRDQPVAALTRALTTPGTRAALVSGGPGVGRTAVVVHVAHLVRDRFPDGQLYADLDQPDRTPLSVDAVLARLLRSLDVTDPPATRDERAARVRAELAARRVLLVLENVAHEGQVRPLLTGATPSAVLMTSRRDLLALPGVQPVRLEPLVEGCARQILVRLVGDRVAAEQAAARAIVDACARLPVALHIAGAWLAARPHRSLTDLADLLTDDDLVLDRLTVADLSVRACIATHVATLRPDEQRLLHQLAHLDTDTITSSTPAELCHPLATAEPALRDGLDALTHAHLLTPAGPGYRMNPLVRRYAQEEAGLPRLRAAR